MRKRFIILVDTTDQTQNDAFFKHIKASGQFGWWHWFNGSWLLCTTIQSHTAESVRNMVAQFFSGENHMVFELRPDGSDAWYGFGPNEGEKNMFAWIRENWKKG
jgi:hypothetical protein